MPTENIFKGIFDSDLVSVISITDFLLCVATALVLGLCLAFSYMFKTRYTKSFVVTLALLPAVVCVVIMMVNGNVGAGVAVAGAFSLVRFRSVPGTAKEICALFIGMGTGLVAGMGYLAFAAVFAVIMCVIFIAYSALSFGTKANASKYKILNITIPEDLDYTGVFDDLFEEYTKSHELIRVKSTNMGSMFRLRYEIVLSDPKREKEFIDKIRCRNGNLEISICKHETGSSEL